MEAWPGLVTHRDWLQRESLRLLRFGRRAADAAVGARWLDGNGAPVPDRPVLTFLTCRSVHVYAVGQLMGIPGCRPVAERALAGLRGPLHDARRGGWYDELGPDGRPGTRKSCYDHAFVILAATSAVRAGLPGGADLLAEALEVFGQRFFDEALGRCVDSWDAAFTRLSDYRGMNANMHTVEALLAAADVTGDPAWAVRAGRIAEFAVAQAGAHRWRMPEHYSPDWQPRLEYHDDRREDPFQPYGATVGHGLEWSRLLVHLEATLAGLDGVEAPATDWLDAARALFDRAAGDGWAADGAPGFVYTTDWDGRPVVRDRLHWVAAEAVGAAAALWMRTGEPEYAARYALWWDHIAEALIDDERGSWHHELDPANRPSARLWPGKPDLYHAFQATLIPRLPLAPSLASAVAEGLLG